MRVIRQRSFLFYFVCNVKHKNVINNCTGFLDVELCIYKFCRQVITKEMVKIIMFRQIEYSKQLRFTRHKSLPRVGSIFSYRVRVNWRVIHAHVWVFVQRHFDVLVWAFVATLKSTRGIRQIKTKINNLKFKVNYERLKPPSIIHFTTFLHLFMFF